MNRHEFLQTHREPTKALLAAAVTSAVAAAIYYAPNLFNDGHTNDESHADQGAKTGRNHPDYHPLPSYESAKGPDGTIDYYAIRITPQGRDSYRIDGGTPAPAPEQPEYHGN